MSDCCTIPWMKGYPNAQLLISPEELSRATGEPGAPRPLLVDLRPPEAYAAGHVHGAVHLDLFGVSLIDTDPAPLKAFMWMIEHLLATRGVQADDAGRRLRRAVGDPRGARVLVSRVLRPSVGAAARRRVRRLDAGGPAGHARGRRRRRPAMDGDARAEGASPPGATCTARSVSRARVILDTRSDGEYCGTTVRAARGGAIPGAVHIEWTRNLGPDGAFKPAAELRRCTRTPASRPTAKS